MSPTGERWRLGHRPALDGLRGIAVLLVVACHTLIETDYLTTAGMAGVTLFFVLSGYLITRLLVAEREERGRVDLRRFYARRARRLLPALLAMLALLPLWLWAVGDPYLEDFWKEALATALYVRNMFFFERVPGYDGILGHGWSLAVEEQFYFLWPVALLGLLAASRRCRVNPALVVGILAAALLVWRLIAQIGSPGWETYGRLDTNAGALLVGATIALAEKGGRSLASAPLAYAGLVGLILVAQWPAMTPESNAIVGAAVAICAVPLVSQGAERLPWLSDPVLRWLGSVSYGWYLWHFALQTTWIRGHEPGTAWRVAAAVLALGLAELSSRFVERPLLARRWPARPSARSLAPQIEPSGTRLAD